MLHEAPESADRNRRRAAGHRVVVAQVVPLRHDREAGLGQSLGDQRLLLAVADAVLLDAVLAPAYWLRSLAVGDQAVVREKGSRDRVAPVFVIRGDVEAIAAAVLVDRVDEAAGGAGRSSHLDLDRRGDRLDRGVGWNQDLLDVRLVAVLPVMRGLTAVRRVPQRYNRAATQVLGATRR